MEFEYLKVIMFAVKFITYDQYLSKKNLHETEAQLIADLENGSTLVGSVGI